MATAKKKSGASSGSSLVKYGDFTDDEIAEELEDLEKSKGSGVMLKLKPGKTVVRFIPPPPGKKWKRVTYVHYIDVPGVGRVSFTCPRMEAKQFCVACDREAKLRATGEVRDEKKANAIRAKRRCFANVIDRAAPEDGPRVLGFGVQIEKQLIEMRQDEDLGGNFVNPLKGVDVAIVTTGTGMSTEYKVIAANKGRVCKLSDDVDQMNDWIESQHNLERFARVLDADEIEALLRGEKPDRRKGGEDDEDERPARRQTRAKKTVDEEIDDAEFTIDEDDD